MKTIAILFSIIIISLTIPAYADSEIPSWIRTTAQFWAEGQISDAEFMSAIEYLVNSKIIKVTNNEVNDQFLEEYKSWARGEIQKQTDYSKRLQIENAELREKISSLQRTINDYSEYMDEYERDVARYVDEVAEYQHEVEQQNKKPQTTITQEEVQIRLFDSKGNQYDWVLPVETYESYVQYTYVPTQTIQYSDGRISTVGEFSQYVVGSFTNVIDDIYDNSVSDEDFIFEIWFITSQLTVYSTDIGEDPRFAVETLIRGGGDCEDTTILIADMIRSSSHTKDWEINLLYFDSDNPENPQQVNHVSLEVDTNHSSFTLETTAKTVDGLNSWVGTSIMGWRTPI